MKKSQKKRYGFDYSTFSFGFLGFAFIPSLFRREYLKSVKLICIQYSYVLLAYPYMKGIVTMNEIMALWIAVFIYITYFCFTNNK